MKKNRNSKWALGFVIGLEEDSAFALDFKYLVFNLDDEGKVDEYQTTVD